jgi:hypothetical protein
MSRDVGLLRPDVGRLDDRPPSLGIGFHQRAERLRRLSLARENLLSEIGKARPHRSASASTAAALSLPTTSFGVPLGAKSPNHA